MKRFTVYKNSTPVYCSISPCSGRPASNFLQIQLSVVPKACNAESEFTRTSEPYNEATAEEDAIALAEKWLEDNGLSPLKEAAAAWAKTEKEFAASQAGEDERISAEEKELRKQGFAYKVVAWIHGEYGDDECVVRYYKRKPSKRSIAALIRGSVVSDDYTVTSL